MGGVSNETELQATPENTVQDAQLIGEKEVDRLAVKVKKMGNPRRPRTRLSSESAEGETDREMDSTDGSAKAIDKLCAGTDPEEVVADAQAKLKQRHATAVRHSVTEIVYACIVEKLTRLIFSLSACIAYQLFDFSQYA
ncbi:hypothetical protein Y032_0527g2964 [Ancylostoma ceylanicum]|nr:hypothetical protein Y032_0527g2964 [Ancylostoma ceylanicum]